MHTQSPGRTYALFCLVVSAGFAARCLLAQDASAPGVGEQGGAQAPAQKWDVAAPPCELDEVTIDTDEGTWMNLDVSPDGTSIVFDLLGDLYTLPITGGEATQITSGVHWDMQPKWSPDGTRIAFTSDRAPSNGDNIWIIKPDGTDPRQVTKESFRLCNSAAWLPATGGVAADASFIVAQKHFSSHRSLGAGEMWLYNAAGTFDGLQMTTRPTEQKNVGEPAFSPDGRYLYYSLDATPGSEFEYNKDSNKQIYCIDRLDRVKGETVRYVDGPGGACRPTPSPDGKSLAFVRRMREKTALFVMDLASGRAEPVYDGLDRDMQETWAIHGVYPSFAWTADSRSLVFWAGGKIRTIPANATLQTAEKDVRTIPFHVRTTRKVARAVRFAQAVSPEEFDVRMLRWTKPSPAGDMVVYQALGKLYLRTLDEKGNAGKPVRLCADADRSENFPSWSRDGRKVVFTTWNDEKLAEVRVVDVASKGETVVTDQPGHYVDPVFTPDGTKIVFGKVSGGHLTDPAWSFEPGVYWSPASGGVMTKITTKGMKPQFGSASDRVYLTVITSEKETDKSSLISVNLNGAEERPHVSTEVATEFAVSPDGNWLLFAERFNVYLAPLVQTGRDASIGPKSSALPLIKLTSEAGNQIGFTSGVHAAYWSHGPTLHRVGVADAVATLKKPGAKEPEDKAETGTKLSDISCELGMRLATYKPAGVVAYTHARVLTMRGDEVLERGTIVVENNRIVSVGPESTVRAPADAVIVDCTGKYIMPGLIDVHAHGPQGTQHGVIPQRNWGPQANLAFGVTTIHDPSNDTQSVFAASELQKAGLLLAPRIFSTGTILYGAAGSFKAEIESLDDALFHLRRMRSVGAFSVKSYNQPRRDQRQMVIEAARRLNMMVVPEGGSLLQHNLTMVVDGHTGVEHTVPAGAIYKDITQLWGATQTGYTPTLVVAYGGLSGENYWYEREDVWKNPRLRNFVPGFVIEPKAVRRQKAPIEDYNHFAQSRVAKALADAGVRVNLGAHGQLDGLAAHWELQMLGQGGMTAMQALQAATINGAMYLGLDNDLGTIQPGKLADFIVLTKDPSVDLSNIGSVETVVLNGDRFDAMTMRQIPNATGAAERFEKKPWYFEKSTSVRGVRGWSQGCAGCGLCGAGCTSTLPDQSGYR